MAEDSDTITDKREQLETLVRRADHLSLFGTLTSLVSTGFLFVEQLMKKKFSRTVNAVALATDGVGIASVFASFYYRYKAGKIALHSSAHINEDQHIKDELGFSAPDEDDNPQKHKWTSHATREQNAPAELQR